MYTTRLLCILCTFFNSFFFSSYENDGNTCKNLTHTLPLPKNAENENCILFHTNWFGLLQVTDLSFYDVLLDFVLLDAFDDLATPPYSVATAVQNRWLSARIKETVSFVMLIEISIFSMLSRFKFVLKGMFDEEYF